MRSLAIVLLCCASLSGCGQSQASSKQAVETAVKTEKQLREETFLQIARECLFTAEKCVKELKEEFNETTANLAGRRIDRQIKDAPDIRYNPELAKVLTLLQGVSQQFNLIHEYYEMEFDARRKGLPNEADRCKEKMHSLVSDAERWAKMLKGDLSKFD